MAKFNLTYQFIANTFVRLNKQHFNSTLSMPKFEIMKSRTKLGLYCYPTNIIRISNYYDLTEQEYVDTIAHEMIHQCICTKGITDNSPHGKVFCSFAILLMKNDPNLCITEVSSVEGKGTTNSHTYHVCMYRTCNGSYFKFVMSAKSIGYYKNWFNKSGLIADYKIFKSFDDKAYCQYTKCRKKIDGISITKKEFDSISV